MRGCAIWSPRGCRLSGEGRDGRAAASRERGSAGKGAGTVRDETCPEQIQEVGAGSLVSDENKLWKLLSIVIIHYKKIKKKREKKTALEELAKIKFVLFFLNIYDLRRAV